MDTFLIKYATGYVSKSDSNKLAWKDDLMGIAYAVGGVLLDVLLGFLIPGNPVLEVLSKIFAIYGTQSVSMSSQKS